MLFDENSIFRNFHKLAIFPLEPPNSYSFDFRTTVCFRAYPTSYYSIALTTSQIKLVFAKFETWNTARVPFNILVSSVKTVTMASHVPLLMGDLTTIASRANVINTAIDVIRKMGLVMSANTSQKVRY